MTADVARARGERSRAAYAPLLPLAMTASTVLYSALAILASAIIDDLGISRAQLGLLLAAYSLMSAVASPMVGQFVDRFGTRSGMLGIFGSGVVGYLVFALAGGLIGLIVAAMVLTIAQALANPSTNKLIAERFEPKSRGLVTGIKQSGVQLGTFLAGVSFPVIEGRFGWRAVGLALAAAIGAILLYAFAVVPRSDPAVESYLEADQSSDAAAEAVAAPASQPPLPALTWWLTGYAFLMGFGGSPVFSFFPLFAEEVVGISTAQAGLIVGIAGLVGGASRILWSVMAGRRGEFSLPLLVISCAAVGAGLLTVTSSYAGIITLWFAALLGWMSISAWNSVAMLAMITEAGASGAGRASGYVLFGFLGGLAGSPPLFGWSVDRFDTYVPGFTVCTACFALAALLMLLYRRRH